MTGVCQEIWKSGLAGPREMARPTKAMPKTRVRELREKGFWAATRDLDRNYCSPRFNGSDGRVGPLSAHLPQPARLMQKKHGRPTQLSAGRMGGVGLFRQP